MPHMEEYPTRMTFWSQALSETFTLERLTSQLTPECFLTNLILVLVPLALAVTYLLARLFVMWAPWVPWDISMTEHDLPSSPLEDFGASFRSITESIG